MKDWKGKMFNSGFSNERCGFKFVVFSIVFTGVLTVFSLQAVYAQESETGQEDYDLIVEKTLDRAERSFGLTAEKKEPPAELGTFKASDLDLDAEISTESEDFEEVLGTKIIPLVHAEAGSVVEALNQMKSFEGEVAYNEIDRTLILKDTKEQLKTMTAFVKEVDVLLTTEAFTLKHVEVQVIAGKIKKILTENVGRVRYDEQANSIVVTDTASKIEKIRGLIKKLDRLNREILIETRVIQVVLNDEHPIGIDWEAIVSDYQKLAFSGFALNRETGNEGKLSFGAVSDEDYGILLEALDTVGVVRTISQEGMKTENEMARTISILSSENRDSYQDGAALDIEGHNNIDLSEKAYRDKKVEFHLVPRVELDQTLTISVKPEFVGESSVPLLTVLESKEVKLSGLSEDEKEFAKGTSKESVTVQMEDGSTVVIGSLFEEVMVESINKVPLLGDLPLLGGVFRSQGKRLKTAEIIAFLTVKTREKKQEN